jgi:hypothetical protein
MSVDIDHFHALTRAADFSSANILLHVSLCGGVDGIWATVPCWILVVNISPLVLVLLCKYNSPFFLYIQLKLSLIQCVLREDITHHYQSI